MPLEWKAKKAISKSRHFSGQTAVCEESSDIVVAGGAA
jgi:hypothetical protein